MKDITSWFDEIEIYKINKKTGYRCGRNRVGDLFIGNDRSMEYYKYSDEKKNDIINEWKFNNKFE